MSVIEAPGRVLSDTQPIDKLSPFAESIYRSKRYDFDGKEQWADTARRLSTTVLGALGLKSNSDEVFAAYDVIRRRLFIPGGRYLYATGRQLHQVNNCMLLRAEDTREGWSDTYWKANTALMTGAGIGIDYSDIRGRNAPLKRTGGISSGPIPHMHAVNELGRAAVQGGHRRAAIWAGLKWNHPDILDFIRIKDWKQELRDLKALDLDLPMPMEFTNVSVILDDEFFAAYESHDSQAALVYDMALDRMLTTGEPGFSIDTRENAGESLRNACTEITSRDDSDVCNLGSLNLSRIANIDELEYATEVASIFLLAGTVYSDVPYEKVNDVREKNRRLGLGHMGVHEWLLKRGKGYGPDDELAKWMEVYARSGEIAGKQADSFNLSRPVKTRAIAPTGTISMLGETTTGVEPVYCAAYRRRYMDDGKFVTKYVLDPTVKRLVEKGYDPNKVEDAYTLSLDPEKRVQFQEWMQQYVDHGISSTINLPAPMENSSDRMRFGDMLIKYLPNLRGITVYPNGARAGQPLEPVDYYYAASREGVLVEESEERCVSGSCGI